MSFESPEEAKIVKKNYEILASIICFKRTQTENDFQNLRELNDLLTYAKNKNFSFKQKNLNLEKLLKIFLQFFLPNAIQRYTEFEKVPLAYSLMAQSSTFPMAPIIDYLICKENIKIEEDISLAIKKSIKYTKDQIAYERVHAIRNIILQYVYEKKYSFIERFVQKKEIEVDNESLKNLLAMLRLHFAISELKQAIKTDSLTKFLSNYIELMNEELKSPTPCDYTLTTQQNIKDWKYIKMCPLSTFYPRFVKTYINMLTTNSSTTLEIKRLNKDLKQYFSIKDHKLYDLSIDLLS